jgi:dTDP-4-amino-4,6-dideoxygalactose transaminase
MTKGIEVRSGFWPLSDMPGFNSEPYGTQKNGHNLFDHLLVLPTASSLVEKDIQYFYETICNFLEK